MEIKSSKDTVDSTRTTSISIGASRTGKTHLIGTMCDVGKVFIIDAEDGLKTIRGKDYDYYTVNNWKETEDILNWFMSGGHSKYTHLAIDSINRIQAYLVASVTVDADEHGKNKGVMTMSKWGIVGAKLRKIVDVLTKQSPTSVHMNVTAMESKDEVTGATMLYPSLSGAFKHEILGYFDTIMYHRAGVDKGEQKYWIQLGADARIQAGTRIQKLKETYGNVMPVDYACIHDSLKSE